MHGRVEAWRGSPAAVRYTSLFLLAFGLGRSQRKGVCQNERHCGRGVGELLLKKADKHVLFKWPKVYSLFVLVLFAFPRPPLPPQAQRGLFQHLSLSLSAPCSVWEPHKSAGCALYICHPLCSVKGKKKICSTPGL